MNDIFLCIDIGGSKLMTGLVEEGGRVLASQRREWRALTGEDVMRTVLDSAASMLRANPQVSPCAAGVTIPGLADPGRGYWVEASFSGIRDLDIGPRLKKEFGVPTYVENDARACALAERLFGVCRDTGDFLYLTVSNGIGGAVFMNDRICYGAYGNAGEIGHCVVEEQNGRLCKCGSVGCLEMQASGRAVSLNFEMLGGPHGETAASIAALARAGHETALRTFALEGYYLGKAVAAACNLLNPARVVIGGGVSQAFDLYEQSMQETIRKFLYRGANPYLTVMPSMFGGSGGLMGAAATALCGKNGLHGYAGAAVDSTI